MARTEMLHDDATLRLGVCRNLLVFAWYAAPETAHIRALSKAVQAHSVKHGADHVILDLVLSGKPLFSDEVRDGMARIMRDERSQGQGCAHVVELSGLAGVTMRAVLSTTVLLARPRAPHKVFSDARTAVAWLVPLLAKSRESWTVTDMIAAQTEIAPRKVAPTAG